MARPLTRLLTSLLDTTGSLGVGVVDGNGLLVQGCGLHGGRSAERVAAFLSVGRPAAMTLLLDDTLLESLLVGRRHCFYLRWLAARPYFVYVMLEDISKTSAVRRALTCSGEELSALLSSSATRQRLEQPRQFPSSRLIR